MRRSQTVFVVVLILLVVAIPTLAAAQGGPQATWPERSVEFEAVQGTVLRTALQVQASGTTGELSVRLSGPAADVITIDLDGVDQVADDLWELPAEVAVPADAVGHYPGSLQLRSDGQPLGPALPLRVQVVAVSHDAVPDGAAEPSPDRLTRTDTGQLIVADELVVALSFDTEDPDARILQLAADHGAVVVGSIPETHTYQLRFDVDDLDALQQFREGMDGAPGVESVSLHLVEDPPATIPNDPEWDDWDVGSPGGNNWGLEYIDAPGAWDLTTGSDSIAIAVLDLDLDQNHRDLAPNITQSHGRGPEASGHGTHVAGTICAKGDNALGITGVTWDCDLRLFGYGRGSVKAQEAMVEAVAGGARIVNMSLQFVENNQCGTAGTGTTLALVEDTNDILGRAVLYAQRQGRDVLWVFAAGNECRDTSFASPASLVERFPTNTMAVASVDPDGELRASSNTGHLVSVAAPGGEIFSTMPRSCFLGMFCTDNYDTKGGTSMAAPHVSGLAALAMSNDASLTASEVKACLVASTASGNAVPGHEFRVVNAPAAVACSGSIDLPPEVDIVLSIDLTGSMGGVLNRVKAEVDDIITELAAASPSTDFRFAVVSYEDYPGFYDSTPCGSTYAANYGGAGDEPFRIDHDLTDDSASLIGTVSGLSLGFGGDGPESYGRVLWEVAQDDTGDELGFRPDALKLLVNFGDDLPHDTNLNEGIDDPPLANADTGIDPGRSGQIDCGGDDIDFQDDALSAMRDAGIRLLHVDSSTGTITEPYWRHWAALTGGAYTRLEAARPLPEVVLELVGLIQ